MAVALIAYIIGILLTEYAVIPLWVLLAAVSLIIIFGWLSSRYRISMIYALVGMLLAGYIVATLNTPQASQPADSWAEMVINVTNTPLQRDGYSRADGDIIRWRTDSTWQYSNDKVVLWLRADSIGAGDRLTIYGKLRKDISRHESFNTLMHNRDYVGSLSVSPSNLLNIEHRTSPTLHTRATDKLAQYQRDSNAHAIVQAMVTGSRHSLTPELRDAYSRTGMAHLLAVSGLHLGIVYLVVMLMLKPLNLVHRGHRWANILAIVAIWLFAATSGFSAPVVRAAIMITIFQIAQFYSVEYISIRSLSIALIAMLVYRPGYIYDISFQLSALAVAGIVLCGVPLMRLICPKRGIARGVTASLIVGTMATLWTLPLISHTFGYITLASIVLTPFVALFTYVIIFAGIIALLIPHPLSQYIYSLCEFAAHLQNLVVDFVASWHWVSVDYSLSTEGVYLCYALIAAITITIDATQSHHDREPLIFDEPV